LKNIRYAVLGGDIRHRYLLELMKDKGYHVRAFHVSGVPDDVTDVRAAASSSDVVILPLPMSADPLRLNGSAGDILLRDVFADPAPLYLGGCVPADLALELSLRNIRLIDYYNDENLQMMNAAVTAEGAVAIAIHETDIALMGAHVLITGFGRIGKTLADRLLGFHCEIHIAARSDADLSLIRALGYIPQDIHDLAGAVCRTDIIFNTVPAMIFDQKVLSAVGADADTDAVIIDLASSPGGADFDFARQRGLKAVKALSLPGKTAPKFAAQIILDTIERILVNA